MEDKRFVHLRNGKIYSTTGVVGRESAADATPATTSTEGSDHHLKTDLVLDTTSGRIVDVWSTADGQQPPSVALPPADNTRVIDLEGKLVLPGPHDSHIHVLGLGKMLSYLHLKEVGSMAELKDKLRAYVDAKRNAGELQPGRWVVGFGWDQDRMGHNGYPSRQDLDEVVPDVPVLLLRACLHIGVTNSAGLSAAGITRDTPSPPGGHIDKDPQGEPTGIVRELALDQVQRLIENDRETLKKYIETAIKYCVSVGLTAVHANDDAPAWQLYEELQQEGKLPIRVYLTVYHHELDRPDIPKPLSQTGLLECHRVKIIADGSLGAETAALRQPYVGKDAKGLLIYSRPALVSMVKKAHDLGYRLEVHAIGDEAAEAVLEAFEKAGVRPEDRPILTHCQILGPDLLDTMARLGVIANVQPQFVTTDSLWLHKRVQPEVLPYCYAWKTMLDKGIRVTGGSDAPIELPDPFLGLYAAIFRHDTNKQTWREEERLTFDEALHIYTASGAFTAKREDELGSLERGKKADFVVVPHRVDLEPALLAHHGPDQVWVDGRLRWHSAMGREVGARGKTCAC